MDRPDVQSELRAQKFLRLADGVIVGSSLKRGGKLANPVDAKRVAALARVIDKAR